MPTEFIISTEFTRYIATRRFDLSSSGFGHSGWVFGGVEIVLDLTKFSIKDFVNLILFKIVEIPNVVININKQ